MASSSNRVALVLSGGGARGAYAVGVLSGLNEILGGLRSRFQLFTGTSVGAINAAQFAANADCKDLGVAELEQGYLRLRLRTHLRPYVPRLISGHEREREHDHRLGWRLPTHDALRHGWGLLDARPFERIVEDDIPWDKLHENVRSGLVNGLIVSGLRVSDGRTTTFAELSPGTELVVGHDPRRDAVVGPITPDHVLASAALPLLFPSRQIDGEYYCDGGLRFNTPMAPAIRAGAERLVVIALRAGRPTEGGQTHYPKPFFLLGKILDALLLDPVEYDLHVLERLNSLVAVLEKTMTPEALEEVRRVVRSERGLPYEKVGALVFRPSLDLGGLAGQYMRSELLGRRESYATRAFLRHAASLGLHVETDFASYLLFDGGFARLLIDLGRNDAYARADEVRAFFGTPQRNRGELVEPAIHPR